MKRLVIINGPPASGKTTVLKELENKLGWDAVAKDEIKEQLLDELDQLSEEDNFQLSGQIFEAMFEIIDSYLSKGEDLIIEGNFKSTFSGDISRILASKGYSTMQIFCHAEDNVLAERYESRTSIGQRHVGHSGALDISNIKQTGQTRPLEIDCEYIDYDNSNGEPFDYGQVLQWVEAHSSSGG